MKARRASHPRVYFSFRSPYSWLAFHDLMTHHPELAVRLDWRPFWEPDAHSERLLRDAGGEFIYTAMSREKHLYLLRDVRRLAAQRGLEVKWPIDREPWWEASHLAYFVAAAAGLALPFIAAVYRARWQQGRDISTRATIAEIANELGLPSTLANAADDEKCRQLAAQTLLAIYNDGVFGVPFFIHGSEKFWGVDRLNLFVEALTHEPSQTVTLSEIVAPFAHIPSSDVGHAGGCG
ncbi:MAG: 2-hydroxychromene-2-carboxylate isomerase [Myxococcota bacterium]